MKQERCTPWIIQWVAHALLPLIIMGCAIALTWYRLMPINNHCINLYDNRLSSQGLALLQQSIDTILHSPTVTPYSITDAIINRIPFIQLAETAIHTHHNAIINLYSQEPLYVANNTHCILANGHVLPIHYFKESLIKRLTPIHLLTIPQPPLPLSNDLMQAIKIISPLITNRNTITIENKNNIWLDDIDTPTFTILTDIAVALNNELLRITDTLKKEITMRTLVHKKHSKKWVADVRFKDQIIIYTK